MAHLRIVRREDLARAAGTAGPRDVLVVDLELLADDLAQQARRLAHALVRDQRIVAFDGLQCPGGVACDLDQQRRPRVFVFPVTLGLDAGAGVVKAKLATQPTRCARIARPDRIDQLANRSSDQRDRVLDCSGAEHRCGIEDLLHRLRDQPQLTGQFKRALEHQPLLAMQQKPRSEMDQARRVKPGMVDRQIKRDLPAQIKPHRVHRPLVRQPLAEGEQQNLGQEARRDRRTTVIRRVTLGEVLITHDPLAVLSQQRVDRPIRKQAPAPPRINENPAAVPSPRASPPRRYREHDNLQAKRYASERTEQHQNSHDFFSGFTNFRHSQGISPHCRCVGSGQPAPTAVVIAIA